MEQKSLTSEVVSHIEKWLTSGTSRNMSTLSRNSDVDISCIRRLLSNKSTPNSDNILKILSFISNQSTIEGLKSHFSDAPSVLNFLDNNFSFLKKNKFLDNCKPLTVNDSILDDPFCFSIFCLSSCVEANITIEIIKTYFGVYGSIALNKLITNKLLIVNESGFLRIPNENTRISRELIKKQLPFLTEMFFKPNHISNGSVLVIESVTKKGYSLLMDAYEEFLKNIGNIVLENKGKIPTIVVGFMDTMTPNIYFHEAKNEELN